MLFLAMAVTASAQDGNEAKAKAILDKLSAKGKSYQTISMKFKYNIKNARVDESKSGTLKMKGEKYALNIDNQKIVSDGQYLYIATNTDDFSELQINCLASDEEEEEEPNLLNPKNLFSLYEKGFKYTHAGEKTLDGKTVDVIKLFPINPKDKPYHTIEITITKDYMVHYMKVMGKEGNVYTYSIDKLETDVTVPDSLFRMNEDDYDEVVDLREDC